MSESTFEPINILGTQDKSTEPDNMTPITPQMSVKPKSVVSKKAPEMSEIPEGFFEPKKPVQTSEADVMAKRWKEQQGLKRPDLTAIRRFTETQIYSMDTGLAEDLYFNGQSGERIDQHKEDIDKALFFVSGSKRQKDEATDTYPVDPSFYIEGVYDQSLIEARRANFLTFSSDKGSRIQNMLARNAVAIAVPTSKPVDYEKGIVPNPFAAETGYTGNIQYKSSSPYRDNLKLIGGDITEKGIVLPEQGIFATLFNGNYVYGNRPDRTYMSNLTKQGHTEIEKRFFAGVHEAGGEFKSDLKSYGRFMVNAGVAIGKGVIKTAEVLGDITTPDFSSIRSQNDELQNLKNEALTAKEIGTEKEFNERYGKTADEVIATPYQEIPSFPTAAISLPTMGVPFATEEQFIDNNITREQAYELFQQEYNPEDLDFTNPKVKGLMSWAAMHFFNTEIVNNPERKHMIMPDGTIKSEYIPSASEILQENLGVSPSQANMIINNNRGLFGQSVQIAKDAIPYIIAESALKYYKGIKNVGVVADYVEDLYGTRDIKSIATTATVAGSKGVVPQAVTLPQLVRQAHINDIGQSWLMKWSRIRNARLSMRVESTYRGLGGPFGRAATIPSAVDQTIKARADAAYRESQRLFVQANNTTDFIEGVTLRSQAWAAAVKSNVEESRLYVPPFVKEAIGDEYYLAYGVMAYESAAPQVLGIDETSIAMGLGTFGAGFFSMSAGPKLTGLLAGTFDSARRKVVNTFSPDAIEEDALLFSDVLSTFTSEGRRYAELTEIKEDEKFKKYVSSSLNFIQRSAKFGLLPNKTKKNAKKLFAFVFGGATPEQYDERMGVIQTFVNAQNTIRNFEDLNGNKIFEDTEFPVLIGDVYNLGGLKELTAAVADRRKATGIMRGDAFALEKTIIEKRQEAVQRFEKFFEKLRPYMGDQDALDEDTLELLKDVEKMYVKERADLVTLEDNLKNEWAANTKALRDGIIIDHMNPKATGRGEIDLEPIDEYFENLEQSLVYKNTDTKTGVLDVKNLYEEFVERANDFTNELNNQAKLMTKLEGTSIPESSSTILVNTAKGVRKAQTKIVDILYRKIDEVDPSVRIDIDFLADAVDENKLLKEFVSEEVDAVKVDVAAVETAIKSPVTKKHHQFFNEVALDTMRKSPIGQAFGINPNASSEETFKTLNGFVEFIQEAKAERGLDFRTVKTPLDQYRFFKKLFTDDAQLLQELFPDMGDVSNLRAIGENLKLTASARQYKNLRQSFTVPKGAKFTANHRAVREARNLLTSRMEDPETGFKSNVFGEQPEEVSEEVASLFKEADRKYADNIARYAPETKTYRVLNSNINNSKNLPYKAFDRLLKPAIDVVNRKVYSRQQLDDAVDQELTVELARMFNGRYEGKGEFRRPYLVEGTAAQKHAQNLILARIREFQIHTGVGAIVEEATKSGRAIVSIDMDLEDGIRLGSVLKNRTSHKALGVPTDIEGRIKRDPQAMAEEFNKKVLPLINSLQNIKVYKELPDGSLDLDNPIPLLTSDQVNEVYDLTKFAHAELPEDLRPKIVVKASKELHSRLSTAIDKVANTIESRTKLRISAIDQITKYIDGMRQGTEKSNSTLIDMITQRGDFYDLGGIPKLRDNFIKNRRSNSPEGEKEAAAVFDKLIREALVSEVIAVSKTAQNTLSTAAFEQKILNNAALMQYLKKNDSDLHDFFEGVGIFLGVISPADAASVAVRAVPSEMQFSSLLSGTQAVTSGRMGLNHMIGIMVAKQASLNELNNFHDMAMNPDVFNELLQIINAGGIPNSNLQSAIADRMIRSMASDIYREESDGEIFTVSEGLMDAATGITNMLRTSIPEVLFPTPEKINIIE